MFVNMPEEDFTKLDENANNICPKRRRLVTKKIVGLTIKRRAKYGDILTGF